MEFLLNLIYRIYKNSVQSVHCYEYKVHDQNCKKNASVYLKDKYHYFKYIYRLYETF